MSYNNNNNNSHFDSIGFIETDSTQRIHSLIELGLSRNRGVIVQGASGVGKTTLILQAAAHANKNILRVSLDEAVDSKDLIGRFIASVLDLLIQAKKRLSKSGEMSWKPVIDVLQSIHNELLPDPVFKNLVECMKKHPKRYETNTGLKLEVAATKVVDYLMRKLAESTDCLSHPAENMKTAFISEVPFSPVDIDDDN